MSDEKVELAELKAEVTRLNALVQRCRPMILDCTDSPTGSARREASDLLTEIDKEKT